jgi:hypothetical protein
MGVPLIDAIIAPIRRFVFPYRFSADCLLYCDPIAKPAYSVTPAKAGVQNALKRLDSGFRRNDAEGLLQLALVTSEYPNLCGQG